MGKKLPQVGLVMKSMEAEFFQEMKNGAVEYVKNRGDLELLSVGTETQTEIQKQIQLVEELIERDVDAIVVVPIDSKALVAPVIKAVNADINVINIDIMLDRKLLGEQEIDILFIGPDNEKAAKIVGDVLAKELGRDGKVIIIEGVPAAMNSQQRKQGFLDSIKEHGLNLLVSGVANWETEQAYTVFSSLFHNYPDVQGVMCANDAMAIGVYKALKELKKDGKIQLIGFDNDASVAPLINEKKMLATIDCFGNQMAIKGIDYAMRTLHGEIHKGWIKTEMKLITG